MSKRLSWILVLLLAALLPVRSAWSALLMCPPPVAAADVHHGCDDGAAPVDDGACGTCAAFCAAASLPAAGCAVQGTVLQAQAPIDAAVPHLPGIVPGVPQPPPRRG